MKYDLLGKDVSSLVGRGFGPNYGHPEVTAAARRRHLNRDTIFESVVVPEGFAAPSEICFPPFRPSLTAAGSFFFGKIQRV